MTKATRYFKQLASYVPTTLPIGMAEFDTWADSIIDLAGQFADSESMKFAIATMVIHLGPQRSVVAKNYFVRSLRKTAANQIAHARLYEIKLKQQKAAEEMAAQEKAANDAPKETPSEA